MSAATFFKILFRPIGKRSRMRVLYQHLTFIKATEMLAKMQSRARDGVGRRGVVRLVDAAGKKREEIDLVKVWHERMAELEREAEGRVADMVANPHVEAFA